MKSFGASIMAALLSFALCPSPAAARQRDESPAGGACGGPVYKAGELTRKARITRKPEPGFTDEARSRSVQGTVRLTAVLCHNGHVTDIKVVQGLPHGMTERVVASALRIRFEPALKDGRKVSQAITLEYNFVIGGVPAGVSEDLARHAGRLVEELLIEGNRRLTDEQLLAHLRTRPGDEFDETTVRRDLQSLLDLGTLDKTETRVSTEQGRRGGVVVIFSVLELPVIRDLQFKGLKSVTESDVLAALANRRPGVRRESVYNPARIEDARRAILELLAARGYRQASVTVEIDELSAVSVGLTFVVKEGPHARRDDGPGRWF